MEMYVPDINEIWEEILSEKLIKKNKQYGNSVYDEDTIFSDVGDPEELIKIRLDDKLRRLKTLDPCSSKYDSELMEIVAYLMHLLNWRKNSDKYDKESYTYEDIFGNPSSDRHEGDEEQSSKIIRKVIENQLSTLGIRRLPGGERRRLREEDFQ